MGRTLAHSPRHRRLHPLSRAHHRYRSPTDVAGGLWEPELDPAEWPEMREYVTSEELQAYVDLCSKNAKAKAEDPGDTLLPLPPPRTKLFLDDLAAADAAKAEQLTKPSQGEVPPQQRVLNSGVENVELISA